MLLVTHIKNNGTVLAFLIGERIYDCHVADGRLPESPELFLAHCERYKAIALFVDNALQTGRLKATFIEIGEAKDIKALVWPEM